MSTMIMMIRRLILFSVLWIVHADDNDGDDDMYGIAMTMTMLLPVAAVVMLLLERSRYKTIAL